MIAGAEYVQYSWHMIAARSRANVDYLRSHLCLPVLYSWKIQFPRLLKSIDLVDIREEVLAHISVEFTRIVLGLKY
jgi:hypothetical protein